MEFFVYITTNRKIRRMKKSLLIILLCSVTTILTAQNDSTKKDTKYQILTGYSTDVYNQPSLRVYNLYNIGFGFKSPKTSLEEQTGFHIRIVVNSHHMNKQRAG
jgi:hypothetical protein